ncbi:PepSY domain-containing protein [Magnetovibrio blakemorei]|uniref:PepSY domain-containing protein n=1 Tax=Magnetovibrio blakemorei TaxID=28181 RepID=A0A1E5Q8V8_9PROT|nr:PepSY domain-containing protein [Magnetovibrio blakemorei]OEJ67728.1 hypothetical protein BEN30_08325 [Magnetovibrio blakemorei]
MSTIAKNTLFTGIAAVVMTMGIAAFAQDPEVRSPVQNITTSAAIERLTAAGYGDIRDIEFKDGIYKAKIFMPTGEQKKIRVDPVSGTISDPEKSRNGVRAWFDKMARSWNDDHTLADGALSAMEVAQLIETDGQHRLLELEIEDGVYEAKVATAPGQHDKLRIDPVSGQPISTDTFNGH